EQYGRGDLVVGQTVEGKFPEFLLANRGPGARHDGGGQILAQAGMGHGERHSLRHGRMLQESLIDFAWRDLFTAAVDHLLDAPGDEEIPVLVQVTLVAGSEPAA